MNPSQEGKKLIKADMSQGVQCTSTLYYSFVRKYYCTVTHTKCILGREKKYESRKLFCCYKYRFQLAASIMNLHTSLAKAYLDENEASASTYRCSSSGRKRKKSNFCFQPGPSEDWIFFFFFFCCVSSFEACIFRSSQNRLMRGREINIFFSSSSA